MTRNHLAMPLYKKAILENAEAKSESNPPLGFVVCDVNGEYITQALDESVCDDMIEICNKHYYASIRNNHDLQYFKQVCFLRVMGEPMEKPDSQCVGEDKKGNLTVCDSPAYVKYVKGFKDKLVNAHAVVNTDLPIEGKCQLTAVFYCGGKEGKSIASYMESLLDCLVYAGIIRNKGHRVINNIDGSRMYYDSKQPRIEIFIRERKVVGEA